jgi:hypothetical protein
MQRFNLTLEEITPQELIIDFLYQSVIEKVKKKGSNFTPKKKENENKRT